MNLESLQFSPGTYLAPAVDWLNANFHPFFDLVTRLIEAVLGAIELSLLSLPPYAVIAVAALLAGFLIGLRLGVVTAVALAFCFVSGLWAASMQTIALVTVAVAISVAIAFPLGILAARRKKVEAALRPVLDIMQTVPPWVYLIPAVMIFSLGRVPAIIATIVYGIPPMLRLTTLAFNQLPKDLIELGQAIVESSQPGKLGVECEAAVVADLAVVLMQAESGSPERMSGQVGLHVFLGHRVVLSVLWLRGEHPGCG